MIRLQPALKPPRDQERDHLQVRIVAQRVDVHSVYLTTPCQSEIDFERNKSQIVADTTATCLVAPKVDVQLFMCLLSALPEETRYILGFVSFLMQRASSELFRCKVNQMAS